MKSEAFTELVWQKGRELYRDMPWRQDTRPYYILVSELMLQQTQVDRVIPKFEAFISRFPTEKVLAETSLSEVLALWSGLGYNRRAKFLHEAAKMITVTYKGTFPDSKESLRMLPGVGEGTSGAILAYAFNKPAVFIETNVRTVYFYHFFESGELVTDAQLLPLIEATLDREHPREFYWAIMDYGTYLKKNGAGRVTQSRHHKKQSVLKGSVREVRGQIIKALTKGGMTSEALKDLVTVDDRFDTALQGLRKDGLVQQSNTILHLTK